MASKTKSKGKPKKRLSDSSQTLIPAWKGDRASPEELSFDPLNPRLAEMKLAKPTQDKILEILWKEMAVEEVAMSIAASGFFENEPLYVEELSNGKLVVIEGNRRLAAVKILLDREKRQELGATDLPVPSSANLATLSSLPIVKTTRKQFWPFEGFKHVNGAAPWRSYDKAAYIQFVHDNFKVPLDEISRRIGDRHATVRRLYRGLKVLQQAETEKLFRREDRADKRFFFSHLYTGLDKPGIQQFIKLDVESDNSAKLAKDSARLKELMVWLFGSKSAQKPSLIGSQNPDLAIFDEVLLSKDGVTALRRGETLSDAADIAKGDVRLFAESVQAAKLALQQARAKVLDGYPGDEETFETVRSLSKLVNMLIQDMEAIRDDGPPKKVKSEKSK